VGGQERPRLSRPPSPPARPSVRPQRRLALLVLLAAVAVALVAFPLRRTWWGGWILAIAEAGIVGGLADWFAVTALFRRPLGLPIPHTALIPANWELMAARVGTMVGDQVLTQAYVTEEIGRVDLAGLVREGAARVGRAELEAATRRVAGWAAAEVTAPAVEEVLQQLRAFVGARPVTPVLVWAIEAARREEWDRRVVAALARALVDALDRPRFRQAVDDLVADLLAGYRARSGFYPRLWMGLADLLGVIDRDRIVAALRAGLQEVAEDPDHPLRRQLLDALGELPGRLRQDPALAARIEAAKAELLASAGVADLLRDLAAALHRALGRDLAATDSAVAGWLVDRLDAARVALITDEGLRRDLEAWIKRHAVGLLERHHGRLATFIERGIHALGPAGVVRLIEEHAGDDLQYIRVNGTVVGGLAGGAIYALHLLLA
jgi:uncharacterized membrane-anchored protein YjiN (DUF445 family)